MHPPWRLFSSSFSRSLTRVSTRRSFSFSALLCSRRLPWTRSDSLSREPISVHLRNQDLFEYTSGRWLVNEALHLAERKVVFDVAELGRLAAQSVNRSPDDVAYMEKLAEGDDNREILITMRDGFKMVAHIPYKCTIPRYVGVASEAATMAFLRSHGIPIPEVYGYSADANNAAGTEYIFTESIGGTTLVDQWFDLAEPDMISVVRQLVQLEKKMMSIPFPAGGALYYTKDMEKADAPYTQLDDDPRFCVGPDTRSQMWFGRRSEMDVNRGPYKDVKEALSRPAEKEWAYLTQFGRPQVPSDPVARIIYNLQQQQPSEHIESLHDYIRIAPLLIPKESSLSRFTIRHRQIQAENIIISRSSDGSSNIVAPVDWHHTAILPAFLLNELPYESECEKFSPWNAPSLPEKLEKLCDQHQREERVLYRRRFINYHYLRELEQHNPAHYRCVADWMTRIILRPLFFSSGEPWRGFPLMLQGALFAVASAWSRLHEIDGGRRESGPCPILFDLKVSDELLLRVGDFAQATEKVKALQNIVGGAKWDNWLPVEDYEEAVKMGRVMGRAHKLMAFKGDKFLRRSSSLGLSTISTKRNDGRAAWHTGKTLSRSRVVQL
ncbi:protein kinase subdomain-containing protein PKL/CAK/Fmp29 [Roridomyces roridus]|uniref:Protein kinase subdomain-containing protein PKL/CAK/Fmp29 n=1 Tax=Roridomyces roridus TaxID=1738132 RepID=A0AAD7FB76_9AGAR|nr:protein kinase subdomain-containing protein PKL/CAK/Fmp29 [Roridomyces roridus]